ncbi:MAG: AMP-binding protein [Acidimicrobiales bacterium]
MTDAEDEAQLAYPGGVAKRTPDKPAVVMVGSGEVMTYRELDDEANRLSQMFRAEGFERGDHVAFCLENQIHYLAIAWGCHYAGLYYTAISSRLQTDEMAYIIENSGSQALITSPYKADQALELADRIPNVRIRLSVGGGIDGYDDYLETLDRYPSEPLPHRLEGQDMLYSSGTTGRPKGVKTPLSNTVLGTAPGLSQLAQLFFGCTEDAKYLSPAPLYHAAPLRFCMSFQREGATVHAMERFDPEEALAAIEKYQITSSQWVPTMFVRMLKLEEQIRVRADISSLQFAIHAAAPCPIEVKQRMIDWWGPVLHEYYAGTEGNGLTYLTSHDWLDHRGSVGKALLGEVHILDDEGVPVASGEEGGVYFSGAGGFEYHGDDEKTAESRIGELSTLGDVGRLDDDGFLYLTDRKSYMIISGGVNVYPQEAENVLTMHPKVFDVAVIGVPNEDFGEEVKAVVQPVDQSQAGPELERELIAYCRERLADVKCPRSVDFRDELPRHPTGKLYKRLLKDEYWKNVEGSI